mmetsp:Transcript_4971/g.13393  ORF Transcript_4971/g.13393 Transcript_4971/m.13393 type:complete len:93 (+) Transcript_4971:3680-3958(+)
MHTGVGDEEGASAPPPPDPVEAVENGVSVATSSGDDVKDGVAVIVMAFGSSAGSEDCSEVGTGETLIIGNAVGSGLGVRLGAAVGLAKVALV